MHIDESLPASRPHANGSSTHPGVKPPTPAWAKGPAMPGGVPPMFASPDAQGAGLRGDAREH